MIILTMIWFVDKDVCNILEYSNSPKALKDHVSIFNKRYENIPMSESEITNRSRSGVRKYQTMIIINQAGCRF